MCDNDNRRMELVGEIVGTDDESGSESGEETDCRVSGYPQLLASALILEDNLIIGMDASDMLRELGALRVTTATTEAEAHRIIEAGHVTFALLDVNLGDGNSSRVAHVCGARGIQAILATAFGDDQQAIADFPVLPVLHKPYNTDLIRKLIEDWGLAKG